LTAGLAAIGIAAVLVIVAHGWGLIWLLIPMLLMARRLTGCPGTARRRGQLSCDARCRPIARPARKADTCVRVS
jgi:hypothetical protein